MLINKLQNWKGLNLKIEISKKYKTEKVFFKKQNLNE